MTSRLRVRPLLLAFTIVLFDCATLEPLPSGTCGNGVVDAQEDCDTFPTNQCGQPSEGAAQCRLKCGKNGAAPTCPDGWGCSATGVCRQPTGNFNPASEPVSAGVTSMLVGDFDGDGRQDVLGSSAVTSKGRIHYFNDNAAPDVVALPGVLASPVVYDFDGDGVSDIAFGYSFRGATEVDEGTLELSASSGFALIIGQRDRQVVTKLFPSLTQPQFDAYLMQLTATRAVSVPAGVSTVGPNFAFASAVPKGGGTPITALISLLPGYAKPVVASLTDLVGAPVTANVFDFKLNSSCGDVVLPLTINGSTDIRIYSPCRATAATILAKQPAEWNFEDPKEIIIPNEPLKGMFITDVDNNGHLDLVIGTTLPDGSTKMYVAFNDDGTAPKLQLEAAPEELTDVPFASGFIDQDCVLDLVVPSGVLLTSRATAPKNVATGMTGAIDDAGADADAGDPQCRQPSTKTQLQYTLIPAPTKKWTVAQVADVNRDGSLDVIGASKYEPDIDVLEGTKTLNMPTFSIPTTGAVTHLAVGDFDFDKTDDIGFVEAPGSSVEREVSIAYGRPLTMPPESPRPAGRLDGIRQLFASPTGIAITSTATPQGASVASTSLAVLLASGDRQPVAPLLYGLVNDKNNPPPAPANRREITTQVLVASPKPKGLTNLISLVSQHDFDRNNGSSASPISYAVWGAYGTGPAAFASPAQITPLTGFPAVDRASDTFLIQMAAADLDGDGNGEIVAVSPDASGTGAEMRIIQTTTMSVPLPPATALAGRATIGNVRPELIDVDGDGNTDLVVILKDTATMTPQVNVFFGDGKAHLAVPGVTLAFPVPAGGTADDYATQGFTQIITAGSSASGVGGRRRELAIVTTKHAYRVFINADHKVETTDITSLFGGTITSGSAVVAVDSDGDGVQDLAIADNGSIRIAHQQARLP